MDMNFPHHAADIRGRFARTECGAYICNAIARQNSAATAVAMTRAANEGKTYGSMQNDTLEARMRYFAGTASLTDAGPAPYGAFMPGHNTEFSNPVIYDQAVYQDGLVISKQQSIFNAESELQITKSGQEN
jgi:hypothetical protein